MSRPLLIRLCRIPTSRELLDPELVERDEMYSAGCFRIYAPNRDDPFAPHVLPLLVDHGDGHRGRHPIGYVKELFAEDDAGGGRWHFASAEVDDAPGWLKKYGAVSFAYSVLRRQEMPGGWVVVRDSLLTEISLLSPGVEPADERASIQWVGPEGWRSQQALRAAADEAIMNEPAIINHFAGGRVLGVR